jgi:predicted nucleic acid-binding protein
LLRVALDTNIVVYAEGLEREPADQLKIVQSRALIEAVALSGEDLVVPAQALAELHQVLVRRAGLSPAAASVAARRVGDLCSIAATTASVLEAAFAIARDHAFQIYDAIILAAAAEARCDLLLTEDLHDGFVWSSVTVTNPFRTSTDPRLARLLNSPTI